MQGLRELDSHQEMIFGNDSGRIRKPGSGRKSVLEKIRLSCRIWIPLYPFTRGDPMSPLRWHCKSLRNLQTGLKDMGYQVSYRVIGNILEEILYDMFIKHLLQERGKNLSYIEELEEELGKTGGCTKCRVKEEYIRK